MITNTKTIDKKTKKLDTINSKIEKRKTNNN